MNGGAQPRDHTSAPTRKQNICTIMHVLCLRGGVVVVSDFDCFLFEIPHVPNKGTILRLHPECKNIRWKPWNEGCFPVFLETGLSLNRRTVAKTSNHQRCIHLWNTHLTHKNQHRHTTNPHKQKQKTKQNAVTRQIKAITYSPAPRT